MAGQREDYFHLFQRKKHNEINPTKNNVFTVPSGQSKSNGTLLVAVGSTLTNDINGPKHKEYPGKILLH